MEQVQLIEEYICLIVRCANPRCVVDFDYGPGEDWIFANELAKEGWRVTKSGNLLCPNCKSVNSKPKAKGE